MKQPSVEVEEAQQDWTSVIAASQRLAGHADPCQRCQPGRPHMASRCELALSRNGDRFHREAFQGSQEEGRRLMKSGKS